MKKIGLVLEGGGMRGLYTGGVLDFFLDRNINIKYVIGVSSGACNGVSYVSGQRGRNFRINTDYISDKRYISLENYILHGSMFGMDFIFDEIPDNLDKFDYQKFLKSDCEFTCGTTDIDTGETIYYNKEHMQNTSVVLRASSAIPIFSQIVIYDNRRLMDGGTSNPIPARKAFEDGCDKVICVLTRPREYIKRPEKVRSAYSIMYRDYPKFVDILNNRHKVYNETRDYIFRQEAEGKALVLVPKTSFKIGRFEKKGEKLIAAYHQGYSETASLYERISNFIT